MQIRSIMVTSAVVALGLMSVSAQANVLGFRVLNEDKAPVAGAVLCVGTAANPTQFGVKVTDRTGFAEYDNVPLTPVVVSAVTRGEGSLTQSEVARRHSFIKDVTLSKSQTPSGQCAEAGSGLLYQQRDGYEDHPVMIERARAQRVDDRRIRVSFDVKERATEYRVSTSPDFYGAKWQRVNASTGSAVIDASQGASAVYIQARRHQQRGKGQIESLSRVEVAHTDG